MVFFLPALLAFLTSLVVTRVAIAIAQRHSLLAHPVHRSSHTIPTPQVGGIGVFFGMLTGMASLHLPFIKESYNIVWSAWDTGLVLFGFLGLVIGLWDDMHPLSAKPKLVFLIILSIIPFIGFLYGLKDSSGFPVSGILGVLFLISIFGWLLFFINAFNFMDGVNGQSGIFCINSMAWMAAIGLWRATCVLENVGGAGKVPLHVLIKLFGMGYILALVIILSGAVLGFLVWNFPKAITFLGDCGSLPLGGMIAFLPLIIGELFGWETMLGCFLVLSPYIYDVIYTLIHRAIRHENLLIAHRSHLYQRLLIATNWSHANLLGVHLVMLWLPIGAAGFGFVAVPSVLKWLFPLLAIALLAFYTAMVICLEKRNKL